MKRKLLIIDDHRIIRDGLKAIFKKNKNYEIVADFDNEEELFAFLSSSQVDIILMDIHLNDTNGIELTRRAKKEYPQIKVVMHTMSDDTHNIDEAKKIGAEGYVLKSAGQKELEEALNKVSEGEIYYQLNN